MDALGDDRVIGSIVAGAPGRRVLGHVDSEELAIRAVIGQQVSLRGAATIAARLVRELGEPLEQPLGALSHTFPSAEALAAADPGKLPMPRARARALHTLAVALAGDQLVLDAGADRERARRQLAALPGIGPWTAEYVAMRALRDPDAFPASDLGVRRALEQLREDGRPGPAERLSARWRPYRAYAVQHLWASLAEPAHRPSATAARHPGALAA
jgi:AraC family transcriptional regulator of adaptative response / DNA-3-methyladenine glycosylase II